MKNEINKTDKKITIGVAIGVFVLIVSLALFIPSSPFNILHILNPQSIEEQESIEELKGIYEEQGITLSDEDIDIETITDENGNSKILAKVGNDDKRDQARKKTQTSLDNYVGEFTGIDIPDRDKDGNLTDENGNKIPEDDPRQDIFIDQKEIIKDVNEDLEKVNEFIENSLNKDSWWADPYTKLLLDQRQTGSPSSSTVFPCDIYVDRSSTYEEFQVRLNGQSFFYVRYPELITTEDLTYFDPYHNTEAKELYRNLLNKAIYKKTLDEDAEMVVEKYTGKEWVLRLNNMTTLSFPTVLKVKTQGYVITLGMVNKKFIMLDIE